MNNNLKVPSLQSLVESDRGSNDSLLAESLQLDIEEVNNTRTVRGFLFTNSWREETLYGVSLSHLNELSHPRTSTMD